MGRPRDGGAGVVVVELAVELEAPMKAMQRAQRNFVMTSACGVCGKAWCTL
jgi:hypothetical protein